MLDIIKTEFNFTVNVNVSNFIIHNYPNELTENFTVFVACFCLGV